MVYFKRFFLFIAVNILVITTISIVLQILGVRPYLTSHGIDYRSLMVFCLVWGMGGAFISLALSKVMAKWMMGVKIINAQSATGNERELVEIVHGLARRAGLPALPEVGIYDSPEINAFATGPTKSSALVAVSTGLLNRMDRNQIEGVLGHEVTHIANGDMVTMTLIQGIVNAFVMFFARVIAWGIAQNSKEENRYAIEALVTIVVQILLSILGMIVVDYFSRQREFRADKGGAQLAGREKMINALKALQGTLNRIDTEHANFSTLKISGRKSAMSLFATHPSLEERIARLERGI